MRAILWGSSGLALLAFMAANAAAQSISTDDVVAACVPPGADDAPATRAQLRAVVACANAHAARQLNTQTPIRVDEVTSLQSVVAMDTLLVYNNQVNLDAGDIPAEARRRLEQNTRDYVCRSNEMRQTIANGGSYGYVWLDRSGALIHQTRIETC